MKQLFVLLLLLGSLSDAWGQTKTYTLKECVEMGIRNNLSLRNCVTAVCLCRKVKQHGRRAVPGCFPYCLPIS